MTQRMRTQYVQFYIDGSAAKKIATVAPLPEKTKPIPKAKPKAQKRIRINIDPVAIFGMVVAMCLLVTIAVGLVQLGQIRQDLHQMETYVEYLQNRHVEIEEKYAESYNLDEIEKTALALGMIPYEQVPCSDIDVTEPMVEEELTIWETVGTFLTGLFA